MNESDDLDKLPAANVQKEADRSSCFDIDCDLDAGVERKGSLIANGTEDELLALGRRL